MKLVDKIQNARSNKLSDYSKIYTPTAEVIEGIADAYAIEFAKWIENLTEDFYLKNDGACSYSELLEIFKKEKGL